MNPERWQRLKELHARALELPAEERRAFLEQACGGDARLVLEALELLGTGLPDDFLEPPAGRPSDSPSDSTEEPRVLGDFELLEELGRGGMGIVYRARQISLQREVALKLLPRSSAFEERHVERFRREALAAAKLQHASIVPIHFVGHDDGIHYFAMELIHGHSLHEELELLRKPPAERGGKEPHLPEFDSPGYIAAVAQICASVADALHHAHQHGVVHRDVKPHNILLDLSGAPHVVDFGLAKVEELGSISHSGDIAGTPYYMSPEQALAKRVQIDHRTDVFSLGVVLYEALTLRRPFEGKTSHEVLYALSFREPSALRRVNPRVPRDLETICEKALAKQPEGRFADAGEFADDLRRFLGHMAIHAQRPSTWTRAVRHVQRRRNWYVPCAAAGLVLVVGLTSAFHWFEERRHTAQMEPLRALVQTEDWSTRPIQELVAGHALVQRLRTSGVSEADERALLQPVEEHLRALGRERLEQGREALRLGMPSPAGTPVEDYHAASDPHYFRALENLWEAHLLLPDDPEVAASADPRLTFPRLQILATPGFEGSDVYAQTIDWLSQALGPRELLGRLPLDAPRFLEPGTYRITIVRPGAGEPEVSEFTRSLDQRGRLYTLEPRSRRRADVLAGMCSVPEGEYSVGDPTDQLLQRARRTRLPAFWIDAAEVTNAEYRAFVVATGQAPPRSWKDGYRAEWDAKPVVGVSFVEAQAYAEWRGKRLPTWFEWEVAARGPEGFLYPWGNEPSDVYSGSESIASTEFDSWPERMDHLRVVRTNPLDHSPFGLFDVLGNAWEWTETIYPGVGLNGDFYPDIGSRLVKSYHPDHRPLSWNTGCPVFGKERIGFRCAASVWQR